MDSQGRLNTIRILWQLCGSAIAIAFVAVFAVLTMPLVSEQAQKQRRLDAIDAIRSTQEVTLTNLKAAAEENQILVQEIGVIQTRSLPKNDETAFLEWANEQTEECGLQIRDFRPSNRESSGEFVTRTLVLSTEGSYEAICKFLDKIRNCPQMIRITSLDVVPQTPDRSSFGATLGILLYTSAPRRPIDGKSGG